MKRFAIAALAAALLAASPAMAADRQHGGNHPAAHANRPAMHAHRPAAHARAPAMHRRSLRTSGHRTVRHRRVNRTVRHVARHAAHRTVHREVRHAVNHAVGRREHRAVAHRYAKVRRAVHARRRFHAGVYHRPRGWYRRHWVIGQRLPRAWFARHYWIGDWSIYGLWAPIDGLIWVRVGPDAMLIDPVTGEIIAVDYGIFF